MISHSKDCPASGNYQPPYKECTCGYDIVLRNIILSNNKPLKEETLSEHQLTRNKNKTDGVLVLTFEEIDAILKEFNNQWISHENEICQRVIMKMQHLMKEIERINDRGGES